MALLTEAKFKKQFHYLPINAKFSTEPQSVTSNKNHHFQVDSIYFGRDVLKLILFDC